MHLKWLGNWTYTKKLQWLKRWAALKSNPRLCTRTVEKKRQRERGPIYQELQLKSPFEKVSFKRENVWTQSILLQYIRVETCFSGFTCAASQSLLKPWLKGVWLYTGPSAEFGNVHMLVPLHTGRMWKLGATEACSECISRLVFLSGTAKQPCMKLWRQSLGCSIDSKILELPGTRSICWENFRHWIYPRKRSCVLLL